MLSLGQRLRQQREQQRISLDLISERTKINPRYLQAIETENFDDLPAGLFRRSFVRQYANALNLSDSDFESELDGLLGSSESSRDPGQQLKAETFGEIDVEPLPTPSASGEHRMAWAIGLLIFTLVACSGIYALWEHTQGAGIEAKTAQPPQQVAETQLPAQQAPAPVPEPETLRSEPEVAEPPAMAKLPVKEEQLGKPEPEPVSGKEFTEAARLKEVLPEPPPAEPPPPPAEVVKPKTDKIFVEVSASEKVWVRMTADHQTVFRGILEPRERKSFEGVKRTRVLVGDAGAVNVIWNGKAIGPIGRSGQMRVIEFTPDTFLILSP